MGCNEADKDIFTECSSSLHCQEIFQRRGLIPTLFQVRAARRRWVGMKVRNVPSIRILGNGDGIPPGSDRETVMPKYGPFRFHAGRGFPRRGGPRPADVAAIRRRLRLRPYRLRPAPSRTFAIRRHDGFIVVSNSPEEVSTYLFLLGVLALQPRRPEECRQIVWRIYRQRETNAQVGRQRAGVVHTGTDQVLELHIRSPLGCDSLARAGFDARNMNDDTAIVL